jgi:glycosyltransferase involved in cell wall biosynthesis
MMKILYHLPVLPPKLPSAEALSQEINGLRAVFGGEINYLNPNQKSPIYLPRLLFGFHQLRHIRAVEATLDLHHFYNPDPFPFPILQFFKRPVIYSLSSGVGEKRPNLTYFRRLTAVTVYEQRSLTKLQNWGLTNVHLVQSGIDTSRFSHTAVPLKKEIRLMIASAPWTVAQFRSKGIDALLAAAQQMPNLRLIFLWRGELLKEMMRRVQERKLSQRVQVIDQLVDVNQILATVHGTVNLAMETAVIKAYPHSLLDSLAAGKPIITSRAIGMADYVERTRCGVVVERVTSDQIVLAIKQFVAGYEGLRETAVTVGQRDFTQQKMIDSWQTVYRNVYEQIIK